MHYTRGRGSSWLWGLSSGLWFSFVLFFSAKEPSITKLWLDLWLTSDFFLLSLPTCWYCKKLLRQDITVVFMFVYRLNCTGFERCGWNFFYYLLRSVLMYKCFFTPVLSLFRCSIKQYSLGFFSPFHLPFKSCMAEWQHIWNQTLSVLRGEQLNSLARQHLL